MRVVTLGLALAVLVARPVDAGRMLYATAATPGRIDGFCLRPNGALDGTPSVRERTLSPQPRRLLVFRGVLYVAEVDRVEAFTIGPGGGLRALGRTEALMGSGPRDLAIPPAATMLYIPDRARSRILGHPLDAEGRPAREFTTCIQGEVGSGYQALVATDTKLYVSSSRGSGRIEVFGIAPDGRLFGADGVPLTPDACGLQGERPAVTLPLSERRRLNDVKAFVLVGDVIYAVDRGRRRIRAFRLQADGNFAPPVEQSNGRLKWQEVESKTRPVVQYQALVHHRSALLGTQFFRGRADSYALEDNGHLPKGPTRITNDDLRFTPVRMAADAGVAYVAAGEYDRVIAYRLHDNGVFRDRDPFSETDEQEGSFPNDVAVAVLSEGCES
jgi:6-phosphogluconolactonase (cycloisomerase 2 family)